MHAIRVPLSTRAAAFVAASALTAGGIMASAAVVNAAPHPKLASTRLSISNKAIAHGKHHTDAVSGVLRSGHTDLADETVSLESRTGVAPRWSVADSGTTGTGGTISFTLVTPTTKTQFKLVFAGDSTYRASHSNVITVR